MPSLRDPTPEDREPSWRKARARLSDSSTSAAMATPETPWSERDSSPKARGPAARRGFGIAMWSLLVGFIVVVAAGMLERRYRLATQGEVTQIVASARAERDAVQQEFERAQKRWEVERSKLEATLASTRRARDSAERKVETLEAENQSLKKQIREE